MNAAYVACVNFMLNAAGILGITYRDINVLVLIIIFPLITLACMGMCVFPYRKK